HSSASALRNFYKNRIAPYETLLPSYEELQTRICTEPRFAVIFSSYMVTGLEKSKKLSCNVTAITQASFPEILSMAVAKGSPYREQFDY
ncbi:hypothetical protein L9F63_020504, partial [Diploptera punctata]